MELKDSFKAFSNRIMHAGRLGGLNKKDAKMLEAILTKTGKKNLILARAILTTLGAGEESRKDVQEFAGLLDQADARLDAGAAPFSEQDRKKLEDIFQRHSLSIKAARKFEMGLDGLLVGEFRQELGRKAVMPKKIPENVWKEGERGKVPA